MTRPFRDLSLLLAGLASAMVLGGALGYSLGKHDAAVHAYAAGKSAQLNEDIHDRSENMDTMRMVGTCRWAHLAAGCPLPPGETMTNGMDQLRKWQREHGH